MYKSNFDLLIDRLAAERRNRRSAVPALVQMHKSSAANKMYLESLTNSMRKLQRDLTPSREEVRSQNRQRMDHFMKSLKHSVKTGSITGIEAIKAQNMAHKLSTQLATRGLI
ncbi:MAG TPA: hypothetical protein ENJ35_10960 [Gammaproteobacteria bacterium]|nr:hypothetical protein [Gammaproteobacteria bacterium]